MTPKFEIREARADDLEDIARINVSAFDGIPEWKLAHKNVGPTALHDYVRGAFMSRLRQGCYRIFVGVDANNGKIAGATCLAIAPIESSQPINQLPAGMNEKLATHLWGLGKCCVNYGFDPQEHFRRAGTFVHPDYQKMGLGGQLTRHCNRIADDAGRPTFVVAVEAGLKTFQNGGFEILGHVDTNLEDFGEEKATFRTYSLVLFPPQYPKSFHKVFPIFEKNELRVNPDHSSSIPLPFLCNTIIMHLGCFSRILLSAAYNIPALATPSGKSATQNTVPLAFGQNEQQNTGPKSWADITPIAELNYHDCYSGFKCARLQVPLDWRNLSDPRKANIAIATLPAKVSTKDKTFAGSVIVNPGGPGASGIEYAVSSAARIQKMIDKPGHRHYEIVGFDPRGVGRTTPGSHCFSDRRQRDLWEVEYRGAGGFTGVGHGSISKSSMAYTLAMIKGFSQNCLETDFKFGGAMSFVSTPQVAHDMLQIVKTMDDLHWPRSERYKFLKDFSLSRLNFIGHSYGTFLGITFASMFPGHVGRMVLDGVVDADDYVAGPGLLSNTVDNDEIYKEFWNGCIKAGHEVCPLAPRTTSLSARDAQDEFWSWVKRVDESPLILRGRRGNTLTVTGDTIRSMLGGMGYDSNHNFQIMSRLLHDAMRGNYTFLLPAADNVIDIPTSDEVCRITSKPEYLNSEQYFLEADLSRPEMELAILCGDGAGVTNKSISWWLDYADKQERVSRIFGRTWTMKRLMCSHWPFENWKYTGPFGSPAPDSRLRFGLPGAPMLFLSARLDPVTPLRAAQKMAAKFPGSRVVIQEGIRHTVGFNNCTGSIVRKYLETGSVPESDTECAEVRGAWDSKMRKNDLCAAARASSWLDPRHWSLRKPGFP
ncbi:hypothetical protein QQS21_006660 [Conoideocrella luteorostrata]|uniref:N-acetyltransferase domain-containing protein n=1 Tax=Conoideocrella luteorostrata TaxID=1105319 RepID=A0AAJ0CM65_9HYPO|nr:hypothetical protein QQS21_006660 [Conoideocrella luteorostrata]